ncbi:Hypothetical protein SMAX5B_010396 [Scophthalmus maximus]|uniref:Uncharacterized protein n=1 Tax=Scophthalmus maximus TaxID=52904 RepID=A0A2U9BTM0_SCOMX|nr:Hypothetical protein SMAX5B_010396 [Scophthalmus maximus]
MKLAFGLKHLHQDGQMRPCAELPRRRRRKQLRSGAVKKWRSEHDDMERSLDDGVFSCSHHLDHCNNNTDSTPALNRKKCFAKTNSKFQSSVAPRNCRASMLSRSLISIGWKAASRAS